MLSRLALLLWAMLMAGLWGAGPARADAALPLPTIEDFAGDADFWNPELSPGGAYLAGVRREAGADYLMLTDLAPGLDTRTLGLGDLFVSWLEWASDDRLLVAVTGYIDLKTGRQITRKDIETESRFLRNSVPARFQRLYAIDRATLAMTVMFGEDNRMKRNFALGRVTDFLPGEPDHILMPARLNGDLDLFRVDLRDGSFERIAIGTARTTNWFTDRDGVPAFRLDVNSRGTIATIFAREERTGGEIKWRKTRTIRLDQEERSEASAEFDLLYPGPTASTYFVAARPEGEDKTGIYLYDFEQDKILEKIRAHERVDMSGAIFNRDTRELLGVFYVDDRLVIEMKDKSVQAHLTALSEFFGETTNVMPIDSSADEKRWLLYTTGPADPGSYHVYDVDQAANRTLASTKFALDGKTFGQTRRVNYTARDGTELHGYLTRPAGADATSPLPLIMMPHGGPEARTSFGFDYTVQHLVSLGYQVFEPNFRGSSGFGLAFANMGRRQWGKAMQTDVDDAYAYLVDEGLAETGRACIAGFSYGGYAALVAGALTPDKYACIIAGAAPSDLLKMLSWERSEEGSDSEAYMYWIRHIGHPQSDKAELEAVSPALLAEQFTRPVLLVHGKEDEVVPIEQSERMEAALKKAGKPVTLLKLEESGHSYRDEADEIAEYKAVADFLKKHLPVR